MTLSLGCSALFVSVIGCATLQESGGGRLVSEPRQLTDVAISLAGFGRADNPLEAKLMEPTKLHNTPAAGDDLWLKLENHGGRVIQFRTNSTYLRPLPEWDTLPDNTRRLSLVDGAEISIAFGVEGRAGQSIPYGSDFTWTSRLKAQQSVFFSVPHTVFDRGQSIYVDFQTEDPATGSLSSDEYRVYFRWSNTPSDAR